MITTREKYYSVVFQENDVNFAREVGINEHDNGIGISDEDIAISGNHFKTREEAEAARKKVVEALKLKNDYPNLKWKPMGSR